MKTTKILTILVMFSAMMVFMATVAEAVPMGTAFTYQGRLINANKPADGLYDLQFKLYDSASDGNKIGVDVNASETQVNDGSFIVELDFGSVFDGNNRWLEIGVRPGDQDDPNVYTTLTPRQKVTPTPYALYADNADKLDGNHSSAFAWKTHSHYWLDAADGNPTNALYVDNEGNVGIGTTTPSAKLTVEGGTIKATNYLAYSGAIYGETTVANSAGVWGKATDSGGSGVLGENSADDGVTGWSITGTGVHGQSNSHNGVEGSSSSGTGVYGRSDSGIGVHGEASGTLGRGVYGQYIGTIGIGVYGFARGDSVSGVYGDGQIYDFLAAGPGIDYGSSSSIRWKRDIRPIDEPLNKVMNLRGVYFNWDAEHGGGHDVGMVAEEVGKVLPEIVGYEPNSPYATGMDYGRLTPLLVEAVKVLKSEVDELKQQNKRLEERLFEIEKLMGKQVLELEGGQR